MIDYSVLNAIPPDCSYDEWLKVGMALKHEGADLSVWDDWSSRGTKYKAGECARKWRSFKRSEVTGGTLRHIADRYGYRPEYEEAGEYDLHNLLLEENIVDQAFVGEEKIPPISDKYNAKGEMLEYFTELFDPDEFVGYCVKFWYDTKEEKWKPQDTIYRRTAGDIIKRLREGSIENALGTPTKGAGAYVRFNPLDGKGENNANVTRWKYTLIESDTDSIEKQYSLIKAMNLPVKFLIHSGGKSLHAIVKVDAENADQYKARVREMYEFCKRSGLHPDEQDKNESRFSRLPGIKRGDKWQYIVARDIGAESYAAWLEWRQAEADDLPPDDDLSEIWDDLPPLNDELIPGILREGHKMLVAGPSKAGKSFMLISLAIAIAEGTEWLGMKCKQGKVVYVNLELDRPSCLHRIHEIYDKLGIEPKNIRNLRPWNLRGKSVPMDKLAPILIHRYKNKGVSAIIIDPIYKVITGDENNATDMSKFCSYFDQVATELGVAMIYCHHHSKGASGKYSNSADRSSGSGVFARDPDAIIDMTELNVAGCDQKYRKIHEDANDVLTGWEISTTLREFAPAAPFRVWFDHPIHRTDPENFLGAATRSDTGVSGRGVGRDQNSRTDWFETVENMLSINLKDTAVSLDAVGIGLENAKKKFKNTEYEIATVDGQKVIHRRDEDTIDYLGKVYARVKKGNVIHWVTGAGVQNP